MTRDPEISAVGLLCMSLVSTPLFPISFPILIMSRFTVLQNSLTTRMMVYSLLYCSLIISFLLVSFSFVI